MERDLFQEAGIEFTPNVGRDLFEEAGIKFEPSTRNPFAVANDTVIEAANAVAGGVGSIANFVSPGNRVSRFIEENIVKPGEQSQSDVVKAEKQQFASDIAAADGFMDEAKIAAKYAASNPLLSASQAAGSFALPMGAVKAAGAGAKLFNAGASAAQRAALGGGAVAGAALSGGDAAGNAYNLSKQGGATEEQAVAAARQASVIPAVVGAAGGLVGAERLVAGAKGFAGNAASRALKTGAVEATQEGFEEGITQFEGQRAAVPYNPDLNPMKGVGAAATTGAILGAATGGTLAGLTPHAEVSFTSPDSITAQAGLPGIVVPIAPNKEPSNVSLQDAPIAVAGEGGQQTSGQPSPGVGDTRLGANDGLRRGGDGAGVVAPVDGAPAPIRDASGQPIAFVDGDPLVRSRDSDLLSRAEAQAPQAEQTQQTAPVTIWTGRAGDGYADIEAAQAGLQTRIKREPELRWEVERMPSGKYRLAGYEQTQSVITSETGSSDALRSEQDLPRPEATPPITPEPNQATASAANVSTNPQNLDTSPQPAQNPTNFEQVQQGATPAAPAPKPLDMRLIPMSRRAEYAAATGAQEQAAPQAPVLTDKPDGTLAVTGDPKALKQRLINAGIPSQSIMKSKTGVLIGRSQVAKVRDILSSSQLPAMNQGAYTEPDEGQSIPDTSPDAGRNIGVLTASIVNFVQRRGIDDSLSPYEGRQLRDAAALGAISSAFGTRFQGFGLSPRLIAEQKKRYGFFNGGYLKGTVYIRDGGNDRPHLSILGHELAHSMARSNPALYADFVEAILPYIKSNYPEFSKSAVAGGLEGNALREEFMGEVLSDAFMDKAFWRIVGERSPSLLRRVADFATALIDKALATVGYTPRTEKYLTDFKRVKQIAAEVMAEFAAANKQQSNGDDMAFARAYHGSPHRFDKFTLDKIGTGEGNQAYGYGLYFTDKKEIADHYRGGLSKANEKSAAAKPAAIAALKRNGLLGFDDVGEALQAIRTHSDYATRFDVEPSDIPALDAYNNAFGQLYEVEIPEDTEMLLWDKPMSEQPVKVREALQDEYADDYLRLFDGKTGGDFYKAIAGGDQIEDLRKAASKSLSAIGIRGIKYLDGSSRGAGDGSYNYVIFDDADVSIEKTYFSIAEDTIEVDGIQRPRTNSKGQPIHPTEDGIRNFWRWFSNSKVVDAEGRPLVVYRGDRAIKDPTVLTVGDTNEKRIGMGKKDGAHWFTPSKKTAASYADPRRAFDFQNAVEGVVETYLRIEDPLVIDAAGANWRDAQRRGKSSDVIEQARSAGSDGVVIRDVKDDYNNSQKTKPTDTYVAFESSQIKSATGNQGTFDPASADIRFSINSPQGQRFTLPEAGATAITRIKLQDDALRMKRVIDAVKEQGGTVGEEQNFYDANTLMPGRVQSMMDDCRNDAVLPMLKKAAKADISMDDLALYGYAKHAEERNDEIALINPKMPDGGSGMTNADAQSILAEFEKSGKAKEYEDLHTDLMAINAATRRIMLEEGLITKEQHDAMESKYKNYIQLRGFENVEPETGVARPGVGRGINVRGKETIRALGRRSRAGDLIENVIRDYQRAAFRSERNNVWKVMADFVLSNPDPKLWGINVEKPTAALNKTTGMVDYSSIVDKGDNTIGGKIAGVQAYIWMSDEGLARAFRHAWKDETGDLERAAVTVSGWYNNLLRNVLTRYNPPFAIVNTIRDAQSGAVAALDELGAKGAKRFAFYYPKAVAASYRGERGWGTGTVFQNPVMDKYFTEFKNSGAITGGFFMKDLSDIASDMKDDMLQAGAAPKNVSERVRASVAFKVSKKVLGALEFMGTVSENTTRFALYMAARDSGRTPSEAALLAKNGTTNFNRKGEWGGTLNALYLFFNAAVQGNAQLFKTLKNPKVRTAMATVAGVGVAAAMFGAAGGGEDDDGQAYWDKIPDYEKERNLIIMLPPGDSLGKGVERVGQYGRYIKIPVQYGLNFFPNIGYMMADVFRNQQNPNSGKTIAKATKHMLSVTFGSVNPFGGSVDVTDSVSLAMALAPTLLDLPIMLGTERNSFGSPVAPSKFPGDTKPDSERMFSSDIDTLPANLAKALNDMGGGNEAKPGKILGIETSVTPGTIENLIRATTGGLGMFGVHSWDFVADRIGDEGVRRKGLEPSNWPAFNKLYGEVGQSQNIRLAGERMREVRDVSKQIDDQLKAGIAPDVSDDERRIFALASAQETFQKEMTRLRKEEVAVLRSPEMTDEKKRIALDNIRAAQDAISSAVNRAYLNQLGPIKKGELEVSVTP